MKSGEFSLELINAETKEPLKEFTGPNGKVYVEAGQDLEYFFRCRRERGERKVTGRDTRVYLKEGDTSIGYSHSFSRETDLLGLWKRQNGISSYQALKFTLTKRKRGDGLPPVGRVRAAFYENIVLDELVDQKDYDFTGCLDRAFHSAPAVACGKKKAFTSVSGSSVVTDSKKYTQRTKRTCYGAFLVEMTIHYASAEGLAQLGLLGPLVPDAGDGAQAASNSSPPRVNNTSTRGDQEPQRKRARTEEVAGILPRVVSPNVASRNLSVEGGVVTITQSHELIDLTGEDD